MAHGLNSVFKKSNSGTMGCKSEGKTGIGSRRIFPPHFKLQVLDSYRNDADCKGNQRATARKYGIHRRQIQKWLQAENNLRNSVGKGKSGECTVSLEPRKCGIDLALRSIEHRQRDDFSQDARLQNVGGGDARVPAVSPVSVYAEKSWSLDDHRAPSGVAPLDFTTHSRVHASPLAASPVPSPCDPSCPIDLSLKRPISEPSGEISAPVHRPLSPLVPHYSSLPLPPHQHPSQPRSPIIITSLGQTQSDVWDLSTKGTKRKYENISNPLYSPTSTSTVSSSQYTHQKPIKLFKPYLDDVQENSNSSEERIKTEPLSCCSTSPYQSSMDSFYYNNNNICSVKSEYSYTLHELQPKNSLNYFYPINGSYSVCPTSDCEYSSPHYCTYEDSTYLQLSPPLKQRQSYSLDFKLSAIECYYQDEYCRGNQRAVASKYNIHRRQVQKWLKQEDELRQRNESVKQLHVVS